MMYAKSTLCEMQISSSKYWTRVSVSISNEAPQKAFYKE